MRKPFIRHVPARASAPGGALLGAADGPFDRDWTARIGDDGAKRRRTAGAAVVGAMHRTVADVADHLAALGLACCGGESGGRDWRASADRIR